MTLFLEHIYKIRFLLLCIFFSIGNLHANITASPKIYLGWRVDYAFSNQHPLFTDGKLDSKYTQSNFYNVSFIQPVFGFDFFQGDNFFIGLESGINYKPIVASGCATVSKDKICSYKSYWEFPALVQMKYFLFDNLYLNPKIGFSYFLTSERVKVENIGEVYNYKTINDKFFIPKVSLGIGYQFNKYGFVSLDYSTFPSNKYFKVQSIGLALNFYLPI